MFHSHVQKYPAIKKAITYKFTKYSFWVTCIHFTTYTIFKWFTQYELSNQCMLYSTCDIISFFKCSFTFFTHKLFRPMKIWHFKHLANVHVHVHVHAYFFSTIECVCYYIDCKVLTILKTNLYHTSIWINDKYLSMSYKQRALISSIASKIRGTLRYNPCILKVFQAFV